jgi:hypothetical protein
MTIDRFGVGPRMSQAVVHGDTVYLAGTVADKAAGKSVGEQTRESGDGQDQDPLGDDLADRHQDLRRNEFGLGFLGRARPHARARDRRGETRRRPL